MQPKNLSNLTVCYLIFNLFLRNIDEKKGVCGSWSYDQLSHTCYLQSITSCCAQKTKQKVDPAFISGYACPHCWSTHNQCPCPLAVLQVYYIYRMVQPKHIFPHLFWILWHLRAQIFWKRNPPNFLLKKLAHKKSSAILQNFNSRVTKFTGIPKKKNIWHLTIWQNWCFGQFYHSKIEK